VNAGHRQAKQQHATDWQQQPLPSFVNESWDWEQNKVSI
jgi:hypothetical protein